MAPNVFERADNDGNSDLPPIPQSGTALAILFVKVTHDGLNAGAGGQMMH
jgi:hypothetical protein